VELVEQKEIWEKSQMLSHIRQYLTCKFYSPLIQNIIFFLCLFAFCTILYFIMIVNTNTLLYAERTRQAKIRECRSIQLRNRKANSRFNELKTEQRLLEEKINTLQKNQIKLLLLAEQIKKKFKK